jgi:hypothetical protein
MQIAMTLSFEGRAKCLARGAESSSGYEIGKEQKLWLLEMEKAEMKK